MPVSSVVGGAAVPVAVSVVAAAAVLAAVSGVVAVFVVVAAVSGVVAAVSDVVVVVAAAARGLGDDEDLWPILDPELQPQHGADREIVP